VSAWIVSAGSGIVISWAPGHSETVTLGKHPSTKYGGVEEGLSTSISDSAMASRAVGSACMSI
jgi:hypothetical protein